MANLDKRAQNLLQKDMEADHAFALLVSQYNPEGKKRKTIKINKIKKRKETSKRMRRMMEMKRLMNHQTTEC